MNPRSLKARDRWLEDQVRQVQAHDERWRGLDVQVRLDRGVAHVDGRVPTEDDRAHVRESIGALRGVHAIWDGLLVGDRTALRVVDIGCGGVKQRPTSIGLDRLPAPGVDVVADVTHGLPLRTGSVDRAYAVHVLEHLVDLVAMMNELHRVLAPGGALHAMTPHWRSVNAVADPTHVRFVDVQTFKYFCSRRPHAAPWRPLLVATDGESVFADLTPVQPGEPLPDEATLGRFFD